MRIKGFIAVLLTVSLCNFVPVTAEEISVENFYVGEANEGYGAVIGNDGYITFPNGGSENGEAACVTYELAQPVDLRKGMVAVETEITLPSNSSKKIDFKYNRPEKVQDLAYAAEKRGLYKLFGFGGNGVNVVKGVAEDKVSTKVSGSLNGIYFTHKNNETLTMRVVLDNPNKSFYYTMTDGTGNIYKGWDDERMYRPNKGGQNADEDITYSDDEVGDGVADVLRSISIVSYGAACKIKVGRVRIYQVQQLDAELLNYKSGEGVKVKFSGIGAENADFSSHVCLYSPAGKKIDTKNSCRDGILTLLPKENLKSIGEYSVKLDKNAIEMMGFRYTSVSDFGFCVFGAENAGFYIDGDEGFGSAEVYQMSGADMDISAMLAEYDGTGRLCSVKTYNQTVKNNSKKEYSFSQKILSEDNKFTLYLWQNGIMNPICEKMSVGKMTRLYVATDGDDNNDGSIDAPFKTAQRARNQIRTMKRNLGDRGATVYFRGGEYYFAENVRIDAEDSGSENAPVVYTAYPGEKVVFSGALKLSKDDFKAVDTDDIQLRRNVKDKILKIEIPQGVDLGEEMWYGAYSYCNTMKNITNNSGTSPVELFCGGKAMTVARYPNEGFIYTGAVSEEGAKPGNWSIADSTKADYVAPDNRIPTPFEFYVGKEEVSRWKNASNALLYGKWSDDWLDQTVPLAAVDEEMGTIKSKYPAMYGVKEGRPFYIYNLPEEIDSPGEYYIDRTNRNLYIYPPEDFKDIYLSTNNSSGFFSMYYASNVKISGITMQCGRYRALTISGGENNKVSDCEVFNFGGCGIYIGGGTNNGVENCVIHDNNGGVYLSGGDRQTLTPGKNYVSNCDIYNNDRLSKTYSPGVAVHGVGNIVSHNDIHGAEHDLLEFAGNDHIIEYNRIYDGVTNSDDAGAIYSCRNATFRGNKIRYNYFYDIGGRESGTWGKQAIFLDDFMSSAEIFGNVFCNIGGAGVKLAGSDNVVKNNIFVDMAAAPTAVDVQRLYYSDNNATPELFKSLDEVPYKTSEAWKKYEELKNYIGEDGLLTTGANIIVKDNIIYNAKQVLVNENIEKRGIFSDNIVFDKDPGFLDYKNGNYSLREDALAFEKIPGFENIPFEKIGRGK